MKFKTTLLLFALIYATTISAQELNRYTDSVFDAVQTDVDRVYAIAPELNSPYTGESTTQMSDLTMHIFQPEGDALSQRPMLICAHGGAFVTGVKEHEDMMAFCELFAEKGYVTATIQYRLGMNSTSPNSGARAVYRGLQDSRAAIRYIKEISDELKVDTTRIYFLGSSAGAFIALHNVFMNQENERPDATYQISHLPPTMDDGPDLGGLDAIASSYHHDGQPDAIIALWGALKDTTLIAQEDSSIPVLLIHGTADNIVPFNVGHPFNLSLLPATYGSYAIHLRLNNLSIAHEHYFVEEEGHEFYGVSNGNWSPAPNAYWDSVMTRATHFLWKHHKPTADFHFTVDGNDVQFHDNSSGAVQWFWEFGDDATSQLQNPVHTYANSGTYIVRVKVLNEILSWDTLSNAVEITTVGVKDNEQLGIPEDFDLFQNHPNPFNPSTNIRYTLSRETHVVLKIYNIHGQKIRTLINGSQRAGILSVTWDGMDDHGTKASSGIYVYQITMGDVARSKKMVLIQ